MITITVNTIHFLSVSIPKASDLAPRGLHTRLNLQLLNTYYSLREKCTLHYILNRSINKNMFDKCHFTNMFYL